jgi:hypothetical protein
LVYSALAPGNAGFWAVGLTQAGGGLLSCDDNEHFRPPADIGGRCPVANLRRHKCAVRIDGSASRASFAVMIKLQERKRTLPSSAVIIFAIIAAMGAAAAFLTSKPGYLVWDRGKVGMPRILEHTEIRTADLPALVEAMSRGSTEQKWATLMFSTPDRPSDEDAVALQISFENGQAGFDWVLMAPRNVEDRQKFRAFADAQNIESVAQTFNGVSYLRVEPADVAEFTARVVTEMYDRPPNQPLTLVYEGFDWPQR